MILEYEAMDMSELALESKLIHGGVDGDAATGAVNVPIYQTSTYRQAELGGHPVYEYSRTGNPTRAALEKLISDLEGGDAGFAFASGMAAIGAVLMLLNAGDRVLVPGNVYGGTYRILDKVFSRFGLTYSLVDASDPEKLEQEIPGDAKLLLVESPANPLMTVTDLKALSAVCRRKGLKMAVDNTFLTPYYQRPLELGAHIVIHSATKYLGGHSDLIAGLVVVREKALAEKLAFIQNATGGVLQPFDSFLLIRGIKTLAVRMDRHSENAQFVAEVLSSHPAVKRVYYPGLPSDPGHALNARQASGAGGVFSFELQEGYDVKKVLASVKLIALAESLGGVESLVCHPATMTHASIPEEIRKNLGITDRLVRLSVGIERKEDILRDILASLDAGKEQ
jgi:cystathionine beta-lyase